MSEWDAHRELHVNGRVSLPEGCTECAILMRHARRVGELINQYGDIYSVPPAEMTKLQEAHRLDWANAGHLDADAAATKHRRDKGVRMDQFIKDHHGQEADIPQMMAALEAADGTVYGLIRDRPLNFRKVGTARYIVIDDAAVRAAVKAKGLPATASGDPGAPSDTAADIAAFLAPPRRVFAGPAPA